jgi:hypothetical protein
VSRGPSRAARSQAFGATEGGATHSKSDEEMGADDCYR